MTWYFHFFGSAYICCIMQVRIEPYTDIYKRQVIDLIVPIQQEEFNIPITPADQPDLQQIPAFYQKDNGNSCRAPLL